MLTLTLMLMLAFILGNANYCLPANENEMRQLDGLSDNTSTIEAESSFRARQLNPFISFSEIKSWPNLLQLYQSAGRFSKWNKPASSSLSQENITR
jgi:hypothetical protein